MRKTFYRKYSRVLEIMPDVTECIGGKLILVGGTALALFYLKHRASIDLDFVPISGSDTDAKERLKGCLSKKGYRTARGAYTNQFVIQFDDTSIKIEVFTPEKIPAFKEHEIGNAKLKVATMDAILEMKRESYANRKAARDLFDMMMILRKKGESTGEIGTLLAEYGPPIDLEGIDDMAENEKDYRAFAEMVNNASKTGNKR